MTDEGWGVAGKKKEKLKLIPWLGKGQPMVLFFRDQAFGQLFRKMHFVLDM